MKRDELKDFLDAKYKVYARAEFIETDPIQVPHRYTLKQDIEISGLFAALFAWGQRTTIIKKANDLMARMDHSPYAFVRSGTEHDLRSLVGFVHRTFNDQDLLGIVRALHAYYQNQDSLEELFIHPEDRTNHKHGLAQFKAFFVNSGILPRSQRHLPDPYKGSAAKRINMYLRWMVRDDAVDFGIWKRLSPSRLSCPLDVHSGRVARALTLLDRKQNDWRAVEELDQSLRELDPLDPVKYDFALFGLGVFEDFS